MCWPGGVDRDTIGHVSVDLRSGWVQPGAAFGPDPDDPTVREVPPRGPTEADGDRLAKVIRNEVGRTFWATGGQEVSGDQAFAQVMARAGARRR